MGCRCHRDFPDTLWNPQTPTSTRCFRSRSLGVGVFQTRQGQSQGRIPLGGEPSLARCQGGGRPLSKKLLMILWLPAGRGNLSPPGVEGACAARPLVSASLSFQGLPRLWLPDVDTLTGVAIVAGGDEVGCPVDAALGDGDAMVDALCVASAVSACATVPSHDASLHGWRHVPLFDDAANVPRRVGRLDFHGAVCSGDGYVAGPSQGDVSADVAPTGSTGASLGGSGSRHQRPQ